MSKEISLQAGQWYRNREGTICYCVGPLKRVENRFMIETANGLVDEYERNGIICKREEDFDDDDENYWKHLDLVEHLPGCDGFDWEPPKPEPKYRPFKNKEEARPFQNEWLVDEDGDEMRIIALRCSGVSTWLGFFSWENACQRLKKLDGTPFGVEVTE